MEAPVEAKIDLPKITEVPDNILSPQPPLVPADKKADTAQLDQLRQQLELLPNTETPPETDPRFLLPQATVREKILKALGAEYEILDPEKQKVLYAEEEGLNISNWRTRIHVYPSKAQNQPEKALMHIITKQKLDLGATYDVTDNDRNVLGRFRNKALRTILWGDSWTVTDPDNNNIGMLKEVGNFRIGANWIGDTIGAIFSPLKIATIPIQIAIKRKFKLENGTGKTIAQFESDRNPIVNKITRDVKNWDRQFDPRLITAAHLLLASQSYGAYK